MRISRKKLAIVASVLVSMVVAGTAFAYWTASGSGTGSANAAAATQDGYTLSASGFGGIYPGSTANVAITATPNALNKAHVKVANISLALTPVTTGVSGCDPSWFTVDTISSLNPVLAPTDSGVAAGSAVLHMSDALDANSAPVDQNACKGVSITLHFTS